MPLRAAVAALLWLAAVGACGTNAVGTDACRRVEQARCRRAAGCPELGVGGSTGVEECVQSARDRCLHGLASPDPGPAAVEACAGAIEHAPSCEVVTAPEKVPACAFLVPLAPADAGPDSADAAPADAPPTDADGTADR